MLPLCVIAIYDTPDHFLRQEAVSKTGTYKTTHYAGVSVCITAQAQGARKRLFEAGALAKVVEGMGECDAYKAYERLGGG
tara:strand:- start:302 stop:541 length:240 start_codon:yes stop_codon:yes gene_type:complete